MADLSKDEQVLQFKNNNVQAALGLVKQLKFQCIFYVPANDPDISDAAKALLYSEIIAIAKLYEPTKAVI